MPFPLHARANPDKPALIMAGSGVTRTYADLEQASVRLARHLRAQGLRTRDGLAVMLTNEPAFFEVFWAAMRSGLVITPINSHLAVDEIAYILRDSGAKAFIVSNDLIDVATRAAETVPACGVRITVGGRAAQGFEAYSAALAAQPSDPLDAEPLGEFMNYSSGTTGRPKGVRRPAVAGQTFADAGVLEPLLAGLYGIDEQTIYLSPAPLYHSAPLAFSTGVMALGGTVVVMERFEPEAALAAIERHRVTHSQWVPTMFVRLLRLGEELRAAHDLSSMRVAIHAAAPCPPKVKDAMLAWWGPILNEYYGATELNCMTHAPSEAWVSHPGTVGRPVLGTLHICGEDGEELPTGTPGLVYSELPEAPFEYHGDPEKTASTRHPRHPTWTTVGDVGYVDAEGYLYLTDRKAFMIISGGVNIYPQEIEHVLIDHHSVADVAVFGLPNEEMGEEVKAVVELRDGVAPSPELGEEIRTFARGALAGYKVPRSVDFVAQLPRLETGKLYKAALRDKYLRELSRAAAPEC
jgi:fatty-acyl-CoA synthase